MFESATTTAPDFARLAPPQGARVLVAGGCGGIGRALVGTCRAIGLEMAVLDLPISVERHPPQDGVLVLPADATNEAAVAKAMQRLDGAWDGLDALVFLVGYAIMPPAPIETLTEAQWNELMAANLRSAFLLSQAALPALRRGRDPALVTVASNMAFNPQRGFGAYAATKGGLISFTKAFAIEHAPTIRANVVAPSAIDTDFMRGGTQREAPADDGWYKALLPRYVPMIPLGRVAEVADVLGPILFLAGPASRYMTGQVLHVNGGRMMP
ncbi:MAG TPA: SDR family NAD(P)-dependent oxidoreductase [Alphaproteobacteria bacterium]|jgi:NAD(P)-dependent dehydrogenase (short-subunit alcohol dehydrogenase family)|nr:SDR family NAD(P)-dependent oxidoreductase [Alphaproteobacteria bacterium]